MFMKKIILLISLACLTWLNSYAYMYNVRMSDSQSTQSCYKYDCEPTFQTYYDDTKEAYCTKITFTAKHGTHENLDQVIGNMNFYGHTDGRWTSIETLNPGYSIDAVGGSTLMSVTITLADDATPTDQLVLIIQNVYSFSFDGTWSFNLGTKEHTHHETYEYRGKGHHHTICDGHEGICWGYNGVELDCSYSSDDPSDGEAYYTCSVCHGINEDRKWIHDHPDAGDIDFLHMSAVGADMQIRFNKSSSLASELFMYSADKVHWLRTDINDEQQNIVIPEGQTYYFRKFGEEVINVLPWTIQMTPVNPEDTDATIEAGGNVMSLLDPSCQSLSVGERGLQYLFKGCSVLVSAPYLPATELGKWGYLGMFEQCTKLCSVEIGARDISVYFCAQYWLNGTAIGTTGRLTVPEDFNMNSETYLPLNWICTTYVQPYLDEQREEARREAYTAPTEPGVRMSIQLRDGNSYEFQSTDIQSTQWTEVAE